MIIKLTKISNFLCKTIGKEIEFVNIDFNRGCSLVGMNKDEEILISEYIGYGLKDKFYRNITIRQLDKVFALAKTKQIEDFEISHNYGYVYFQTFDRNTLIKLSFGKSELVELIETKKSYL